MFILVDENRSAGAGIYRMIFIKLKKTLIKFVIRKMRFKFLRGNISKKMNRKKYRKLGTLSLLSV